MGRNGWKQRGQSLVETALILPVILLLLAGVVEVSNLLITTNRIETAATAAARFAADGGRLVHVVALNSVTQTLDLDEGVWDIWVVEGEVNSSGDAFSRWEVEHVYGIGRTRNFTEVTDSLAPGCTSDCISTRILTDLQTDENGNYITPDAGNPSSQIAADLEVVGVYVSHEVDSILGLDSFELLGDVLNVRALGTMRAGSLATTDPLSGCATAFPLVVAQGTRPILEEATYNDYLTNVIYPTNPPTFNSFQQNYVGSSPPPLIGAKEGYLYYFSSSPFIQRLGYAKWNSSIADGNASLAADLAWPGTVGDATRGFFEIGNALDTQLQIGDRIGFNSLSSPLLDAGVQAQLQEHIDRKRGLRIIVEEDAYIAPVRSIDLPPPVNFYEVQGFANIRIHAYGGDFIIAEFINWDTSCGQTDQD